MSKTRRRSDQLELPPVAGALCFTVTEDPDPKTVTRVVELVRELQEQSVA